MLIGIGLGSCVHGSQHKVASHAVHSSRHILMHDSALLHRSCSPLRQKIKQSLHNKTYQQQQLLVYMVLAAAGIHPKNGDLQKVVICVAAGAGH